MSRTHNVIIAASCFIFLVMGYLELTGSHWAHLVFRALLSGLFVAAAWVQVRDNRRYFTLILLGLIFGWLGDFFLAFKANALFLPGLASFLIGHVFYIAAFAGLTKARKWISVNTFWIAAFAYGVFLYFEPNLGAMRWPVLMYIVVISLMVNGAVAVFRTRELPAAGRFLVLAGAIMFYLSDIGVARNVFMGQELINTLAILLLYNPAQFFLAFSIGRFPENGALNQAME